MAIWRTGLDLFHGTAMAVPVISACPTIVTIFDLIPHVNDTWLPREVICHWKRWLPQILRRVRHIIAISESTKRDLLKYYRVPENLITVIPLGVAPSFLVEKDPERLKMVLEKYQIHRPYILFVGTVEPRKNLVKLIKAFLHLNRTYKIPHELVICGQWGWAYEEVQQLIESQSSMAAIKRIEYADREDLPFLYSAADLFAYPSLYEGFGLPVLEAMACGVPVLTSDRASLPEVVGDAAILVNPESVDEMGEALWWILSDSNLCARLRSAGRQRASAFTWQTTAQATLKIYESVV